MFMSLAFMNAALLSPATATTHSIPAPCHEDSSTPPVGHHHSNHDCCIVGHNRALPAVAADLSAAPIALMAKIDLHITAIDSGDEQAEFNDSGPPGSVPLRI